MKRRLVVMLGASMLGLVLSACAYKPLKAPCGLDEGGQPLAYAATVPVPEPFTSLDPCGPMQPI